MRNMQEKDCKYKDFFFFNLNNFWRDEALLYWDGEDYEGKKIVV